MDLAVVSQVLKDGICAKLDEDSSLRALCSILAETDGAVHVDYDYDVISHAVTITILWPPVKRPGSSRSRIAANKLEPEDRLEVGILASEKADEPEELSMGGYLTVIGDDNHPSECRPARPHQLR